jgi:hypothetical protein
MPPAARRIGVPREFLIDFNRVAHFFDWTHAECEAEKARIRGDAAAMADVPRLARAVRALDVVARHYGWTDAERAEWRAPLRTCGDTRDYIATLGMAIQHGYRQTPENNHIRLAAWLAQQGMDPIATEETPT